MTDHVTNGGYFCFHDVYLGNIDLRLSCYFVNILSIRNKVRVGFMM